MTKLKIKYDLSSPRYHHSAGDSMLVEDPVSLDKCAAIWAAAAYVVADLSVPIPKVIVAN